MFAHNFSLAIPKCKIQIIYLTRKSKNTMTFIIVLMLGSCGWARTSDLIVTRTLCFRFSVDYLIIPYYGEQGALGEIIAKDSLSSL